MSDETKTPQAGEWWINSSGKIRYIIGVKLCGSIVYEDFTGRLFSNGRSDWSDWHHEPRCDSFDWVEPPAIDPGDGWELLPVGTMLQEGDEFESGGDWNKTCYPGTKNIKGWTYRRRKPPAEVWPKYVANADKSCRWYIKRISANSSQHVSSTEVEAPQRWGGYQDSLVESGSWIEVTESEAKARVKPAEPITAESGSDRIPDNRPAREVIMDIVSWLDEKDGEIASPCMALETAQQWLDDNPEDPPPFAKPFTNSRSGTGIQKDHVSWRPNGQRHEVATEVTYHAETPAESPDDWVTQDRVPARPGIDERRYHYSSGDISAWADSACMDWNRPVMNRAPIKHSGGWVELRCRRKDLPPVESTDDWVETTDPEYVLRAAIDEVLYSVENIGSEWQKVYPSAGMKLGDSQYEKARCRRRDLPAPQPKTMDVSPGEGWRWVAKDEPWQEGDDCLICDFKHAHTHNCQCWRRRIVPQPKRTPVRLFVSADVRWGDRYIVSVKDGNPNPERHQEVKFDGSRFYVEGIE